jgi:hypothetical protein
MNDGLACLLLLLDVLYKTVINKDGSYYLGELLAVLLFLQVVPNPLDLHILLMTGDDLILYLCSSILF